MSREQEVPGNRQRVLVGVLVAIAIVTTIALFEILGTVFLAITVAYVLSPARRWLRRRLGPVSSTILVTVGAVLGIVAIFAPIAVVLFVRFDEVVALLATLPDVVQIGVGPLAYEITLQDLIALAEGWLRRVAVRVSAVLPAVLVKFALFGFVVFALLHNERDISTRILGVVPPVHRDVIEALHRRARDTLFAIYVLQGATALATTLLAIPVFLAFGYSSWVALAVFAGILQFVPVIGPSLLILALTVGELLMGDPVRAVGILVVGGVLVAAVPDVIVRPELAQRTIKLSSTLYFIGFVGGLLSLGPIGIIAGPLLVALLVEAVNLVTEGFAAESYQPEAANAGE